MTNRFTQHLLFQILLSKSSDYSRQLNPSQDNSGTEYKLLIPRHWDFSRCQDGRDASRRVGTYERPVETADILVGDNHPQFGGHPWTLQHQGCGHQGLVINVPISFLTSSGLDADVRGRVIIYLRHQLAMTNPEMFTCFWLYAVLYY